jgi:hypothetical protein
LDETPERDVWRNDAFDCAIHLMSVFESYGIKLTKDGFEEIERIIAEHMQEYAERLNKPP